MENNNNKKRKTITAFVRIKPEARIPSTLEEGHFNSIFAKFEEGMELQLLVKVADQLGMKATDLTICYINKEFSVESHIEQIEQ